MSNRSFALRPVLQIMKQNHDNLPTNVIQREIRYYGSTFSVDYVLFWR